MKKQQSEVLVRITKTYCCVVEADTWSEARQAGLEVDVSTCARVSTLLGVRDVEVVYVDADLGFGHHEEHEGCLLVWYMPKGQSFSPELLKTLKKKFEECGLDLLDAWNGGRYSDSWSTVFSAPPTEEQKTLLRKFLEGKRFRNEH